MNKQMARGAVVATLVVGVLITSPGAALAATATIDIASDWGTGYVGQINVRNTESSRMAGWRLEFDLPADTAISNGWNVAIDHVGTHYTVTPRAWIESVAPGATVTAGFLTEGSGRPSQCLLNGRSCAGTETSPDVEPPSAPGPLGPAPTAYGWIGFTWAPAHDDRGVARYEVFVNDQKVAETTGTSFVERRRPISVVYGVRAVDAAGNLSPFSTWSVARAADTEAPSTPGDLRLSASPLPGSYRASWAPSTDNVAVAGYEVTTTDGTIQTSATLLDLPLKQPGNYTVTVRAYDAGGNLSPPAEASFTLY